MTAEQAFASGGKPFVSFGERVHNELTYRGVDLALNAASGVAFTFLTSRTKLGQKYYTNWLNRQFETVLTPVFKNAKEPAKWGTKFVSIMFGGTITIPPIMYLEDQKNKLGIVRSLDEMYYGKDRVHNDPMFEAAYENIRNEPPKDFGTGLATRFIALAPLFAGALTMPRTLTKWLYDPVAKGSKWAADKMGIKPKGFLLEKGLNEEGKLVTNWEQLHRLIGFDLGLTAFYSVLHEYAYKAASAFSYEKEKNNIPQEMQRPTQLLELTQEIEEEEKKEKHAHKSHEKPDTKIHQHQAHHMERVGDHEMAQHV